MKAQIVYYCENCDCETIMMKEINENNEVNLSSFTQYISCNNTPDCKRAKIRSIRLPDNDRKSIKDRICG